MQSNCVITFDTRIKTALYPYKITINLKRSHESEAKWFHYKVQEIYDVIPSPNKYKLNGNFSW